jgi:hypothetical protein
MYLNEPEFLSRAYLPGIGPFQDEFLITINRFRGGAIESGEKNTR